MRAANFQTHLLPTGALVRTPSSLNSLSKMNRNSKGNPNIADILRCYVDDNSLSAVRGKQFFDSDTETRQKVKYHTTFSCSLSAKLDSTDASSNSVIAASTNSVIAASTNSAKAPSDSPSMSKKKTNTASYILEPKHSNYSYARSVNSENSQHQLTEYTDNYFDSLDLPGHFNTRGIYGQRANVTAPPLMRRANSDVNLFHTDFIRAKKESTSYSLKIPSTERGLNYLRGSKGYKGYDAHLLYKNKYLKTVTPRKPLSVLENDMKNKRAEQKSKPTFPKFELPDNQDVLTVGNPLTCATRKARLLDASTLNNQHKISVFITPKVTMNTERKRHSIDVSTQTILDLDDETDYILL